MFGTAGLPHILMRFFTVPDAKAARKSVLWATGWIGYFYLLTFIIGFGAIVLVGDRPDFLDAKGGAARRQQHGGDPPGQRGRRQPLPRLHLGGGLRDHPGGGRRADAVGRLGGLPRPLRHRDPQGRGRSARRSCASRGSRRWSSASSRSCSASCSRSRTSPSWSAWPSRSRRRATSRCCCCRCCGRAAPRAARSIGGSLGLALVAGADDPVAGGVGDDARQSEGLGDLPLHLAGAVLDAGRLPRHLAGLGARPQPARAGRPRRLPRRSRSARKPASARRRPLHIDRTGADQGLALSPAPARCAAGYNRARFLADVGAGLTVGIVALPLAMAFAIASRRQARAGAVHRDHRRLPDLGARRLAACRSAGRPAPSSSSSTASSSATA